jgi:5-methylthioadenosine/S-adenosylhomocysteine deaminase
MYDPVSHLVYSANGGDVRDVIIDGKVIVRDRALLTIPVEAAMETVTALALQISAFSRAERL